MIIVQVIPMFSLAGAETMCENLSIELKKQGNTVYIISLYRFYSAITQRLESNGIKIIYLDKKRGFDFSVLHRMYKALKEIKPDVIHSHLYSSKYAMIAASLLRIPCKVHTVHNIATKETNRLGKIFNYVFIHYCHVIPVSLSNEIQKTVLDTYHINESQSPVIFNGIDLNKCIRKSNYETNGQQITYINIARFSKQKNHIRLIKAFMEIKKTRNNVQLILIGTGEEEGVAKDYVKELNIQDSVLFMGKQDNVYDLLNKADVFVLSSDYEGMPMSILEAMGTGLPVISTNVGGISSIITNDTNGILTGLSFEEIAQAMERMLSKEMRERIGHAAVERVTDAFSIETTAEKYYSLYNETLNNFPRQ